MLSCAEIQRKVKENYEMQIDTRTIRRNINLLKYKLNYDISTREDNGKGYYINRDPETDFEPGEIRAIIDNFSYANYIVPSIVKDIIKKCKNIQTVYENEKIKDYQIYAKDSKTENVEVLKNIEDISNSIYEHKKIKFEYWKYTITNKLEKKIVSNPIVSPFAIVYNKQEFYLIGIVLVKKMVEIAKPRNFKDLVYISALSHGARTWNYNACLLIEEKGKKVDEIISNRADMYNYLLNAGIDKNTAYDITLFITDGKALKGRSLWKLQNEEYKEFRDKWGEYKKILREHNIPNWYIEDAEKIEYLFLKSCAIENTINEFKIG